MTGKTIILRIASLNTINDLKARIYEQEGIPPEKQCLLLDGRQLCDGNQTLLENNIGMESTIFLVQCQVKQITAHSVSIIEQAPQIINEVESEYIYKNGW
ncbi:hypothetical protein ACS0TY_018242 [Phlomoides rotata]